MVTHLAPDELIRKVRSLSLIAFERSTEVDTESAKNRSKAMAWTQADTERTYRTSYNKY